ncbi:MAG: cyclic nucleotide-binding domain-containing protein [Treponema sp.]|jgi:CRP-like cAMP-binding protein|nr:cyclic nucleotide-binding domain-containing protein [Treponema sp.]
MIKSTALQQYSLFGGLLEEQIDQILPLMEQEDYQAGDNIIVEGEPNDKIRFILSGRVAVVKNRVTLIEFKEGDAFGEMEVLDVMPSAATNVALEPTRVMSISNRALRSIYKTDVKAFSLMLMNLARDLSRRLRLMNNMVTDTKPPAESS